MKKLMMVAGLFATMLIVSGCASKAASVDQTVAPQDTPAAHHDYKGEIGSSK